MRNSQDRPTVSEFQGKTPGDVLEELARKVEVFTAGCPACQKTVELVQRSACPSCEIAVLDMKDEQVARRAELLGIRTVPAVAIDGQLADCCAKRGPEEASLRAGGLGQPVK